MAIHPSIDISSLSDVANSFFTLRTRSKRAKNVSEGLRPSLDKQRVMGYAARDESSVDSRERFHGNSSSMVSVRL